MRKIKLEGLDEVVYHEILDNGLNIYTLRKKDFNSFSAYFITNYGALIDNFKPIGEDEMHKFPNGIAHFLEHKLFEQEIGPSVMEKFSSLGGACNAFTNYLYTVYYVNGTDNFYENLNFLIDYVQSPYFTNDNVEKEKGIINQERLMIKDNPYRTFYMKILDNMFVNYKYGMSIVGEKNDIYNITKDDLYRCYNTFYNPSNMSLIVVSNESPEKVIEEIKRNQSKKIFDKQSNIEVQKMDEPKRVNKEFEIIYDNVTSSELGYSIKIKSDEYGIEDEMLLNYLYILFCINFGKISGFNLNLKEKNLMDGNISVSINKYEDYVIISISLSSNNIEDVIKLIDEKLDNLIVDEENFDLIKKTLISRFIYSFASVDSIMNYLYNDYYDNKTITGDKFIKYKNLNYKDFVELYNKIDLKNKSITIMKPLKDKE